MTTDGKNEVIICWNESEAGPDIGPYIVTDPVNVGTYNYHPGTGLGHAIEDVLPYYLWGNSPQDTTNIFERIIGN